MFLLFSMLSTIIVAAGSSTRVGFDKLRAKIAGRAVIQHAVAAFENAECVTEIIVVCRDTKAMRDTIGSAHFTKVRAGVGEDRIRCRLA
jgi:CTP:molybdopterin cytidylyltransferase MocA